VINIPISKPKTLTLYEHVNMAVNLQILRKEFINNITFSAHHFMIKMIITSRHQHNKNNLK